MHLTVCSYQVTYVFKSDFTLHFYLNVKQLLSQNRRDIWSLNDCNGTRTENHLVLKQTLNHLAKLTKWFSWAVSTYLYATCDCIFLSCHLRVSEWIHTLCLSECQETSFSKQLRYLKFKWLQQDSNSDSFSSETNTQTFGQTGQMIELSCEYLSVRYIWLCVLIISRTCFRVNPHSIFAWMSRNCFLETSGISEV